MTSTTSSSEESVAKVPHDAPRKDVPRLVAPRKHTAVLVALILSVFALGTWINAHKSNVPPPPLPPPSPSARIFLVYVPMLLMQWGLTAYVSRIGLPRNILPDLIGKRWSSRSRAIADLACAVVSFFVIIVAEWIARRLFPERQSAPIVALLPHSFGERASWAVVALSVGFCEEVIFRGYLQMQFAAMSKSRTLGVVAQAVLFGMAHGEQGVGSALRIAMYAVVFGALASWRRTLIPGMLCHAAIDLVSVLGR